MPHDTALIATISVGLVAAFIGGFVASRLRLPPIVGYLLAGIAIGPFTPGFVGDAEIAPQLAELGVILLMFGVGMHFSIRDLLAVRRIALPGAIGQIAVATLLGIGITSLWGWSFASGLVLGLALSVASTVVLLRALLNNDMLDAIHGRIAVGWLIVEDLFTILVLILLPILAVPLGGVATGATGVGPVLATLGIAVGKLALFGALMFLVGTRLVPWLLGQVARHGSNEMFTLAVLAMALGIAFGAASIFGVSFALGAFVAGLVVSESDLSHRAATDAVPFRDAFAVLFFVSVGMLLDPAFLLAEPLKILGVVAIIVVGKALAAFLLVLAFGYPLRTGLVVAAGLAQVGEFSFILAELGHSLRLLPDAGQQLILAGAIFSITLNPLLFRLIDPLEDWLRARPRLAARLERHASALVTLPEGGARDVRDHAIICGYGRVGSVVGMALERHGCPYIVIEQDHRRVEELRARNIDAIYGDAAAPKLLEHAHLGSARALVVATNEALVTRQIVEHARHDRPELPIIARTHSWEEVEALRGRGVEAVVMGELELALAMADHVLHRCGVSGEQIEATVRDLRQRVELRQPRQIAGLEPPSPLPA
jgi:monovalent cation:H+ antiporter-2, CPA2 family